jgi:large subunit ribosomal protein L25
MAQALKIDAELRETRGKNAARRLRRSGRIPAVVYGGGGSAVSVAVDPRQVAPVLYSEAGHTSILTMEVKGSETARVMLRDWQTEPIHGSLLHLDFVRVTRDTRLRVKVPIHVTGEAQGVKVQGGIFEFVLREVEIECLPDEIPEHISVDVTDLTIGRNIRVAHLPVSPNVKVLTDSDRVVAHVVALKLEEEKPAVEGVEAAAPVEPELIRKGKAEEEAGEGPEKEKESKS